MCVSLSLLFWPCDASAPADTHGLAASLFCVQGQISDLVLDLVWQLSIACSVKHKMIPDSSYVAAA